MRQGGASARRRKKSIIEDWAFFRVQLDVGAEEYLSLTQSEKTALIDQWKLKEDRRLNDICSLFAFLENAFFRRGKDRYGRDIPKVSANDFKPNPPPKFQSEEDRIDHIWKKFNQAFPKELQATP